MSVQGHAKSLGRLLAGPYSLSHQHRHRRCFTFPQLGSRPHGILCPLSRAPWKVQSPSARNFSELLATVRALISSSGCHLPSLLPCLYPGGYHQSQGRVAQSLEVEAHFQALSGNSMFAHCVLCSSHLGSTSPYHLLIIHCVVMVGGCQQLKLCLPGCFRLCSRGIGHVTSGWPCCSTIS